MASIRKRGNSYLIVVSMGYDCAGNRLKSMQQTVHPPAGMTPKQTEKWLNEQAVLFELSCKQQPQQTASNMTLAEYSKYWFENIAPNKLASSTVAREKSDIDRFLPHIGHYKLCLLYTSHAVCEYREEQHAEQCAYYVALAAGDRQTADDDRRDAVHSCCLLYTSRCV